MIKPEQYDKGYYEDNKLGGYSGYVKEATPHLDEYTALLKKIFPEFTTFLDVGCAYGTLVEKLNDSNMIAAGIDISEWAITQAIDYCQLFDGLNIPMPDKSFEVVVCIDTLEHVPYEDAPQLVKEMVRVSKKYLYFVIGYGQSQNDQTHCSVDRGWWQRLFNELGFKRITRIDDVRIPDHVELFEI